MDVDAVDFDVGARLKQVRETNGLSQRQLAQRAGVTNGTISLIEQNRCSPSVSSLRKVLQGIPMSLAEFFSPGELPPREQIFFKRRDLVELTGLVKSKVGTISYRQVGDLRGRNLQVLHEKYAPGADTGGRTMLQHESEEGGIVIRGRIELTVGDRKEILEPGDAYLFDSRIPHRFRNVGDEECEIISACTPPYL
ncbi:cupin domain-containing protein [Azospirillum rugosum]|uniref:Transcriptional regulator with XRE-family HTH domain n=1 Tax=Azospirillum rugosum TaxID=416170 RepID=A0ABS4SGQ7_9PROT|nr:cupin domain-containing protein [Azospirillum rugosum]MBP2291753.1 transcriptional regulator with XRE-family HTH domain [Azospirillum rugosum]MDQ0524435.1 transcriptional regulator with XRE-family HTH domain [Azospirillum rugosum]